MATGTRWLLVVWPGQVNEIRCGAPSNAWMVCGDGAQGALALFELADRAPLGCLDDQHALQRARLQAELARPAYDGAGGIAIRHTLPGAPLLQLLCSIVGWTVRSLGSQVLSEGTLR